MSGLFEALGRLNEVLWGDCFIALVFAACIYLSLRCGFIQLKIGSLFRETFGNKKGGRERSRAVSTALAASMGTGNIIGTAAALETGGEGAVFWMAVTALFGMGAAYAENYLGVRYRNKKSGPVPPMGYIKDIPAGGVLSVIYTIACVAAAYFTGNMIQGNAVCTAAAEALSGDIRIVAAVFAVIGGAVILGGTKRIAGTVEKIIPFASVAYIIVSLIALAINYRELLPAAVSIVKEAFGVKAVTGGAVGYTVRTAVSTGLRRGIFSNEAGMGSSVLVHAECGNSDPDSTGKWAACEVFIDTVICCTLTALVLITSKADYSAENAAAQAFTEVFGKAGGIFVTLSVIVFAAASMLGWCCYGEIALSNIARRKSAVTIYRLLHIVLLYIGGVMPLKLLWQAADVCIWVMVTINLAAVVVLFKKEDVQTQEAR